MYTEDAPLKNALHGKRRRKNEEPSLGRRPAIAACLDFHFIHNSSIQRRAQWPAIFENQKVLRPLVRPPVLSPWLKW